MANFPVPIRFELPEPHWRAVHPDSLGIQNALFAALRDDIPGTYTPIISISGGWRTDKATMEQIADEAVARLREETGRARLLDRRMFGGAQTPSYSQVMRTSIEVDGQQLDLTRLQAVMGFVEPENQRRRAVLIIGCTCLGEQVQTVTPEFRSLVASLRVDTEKLAG